MRYAKIVCTIGPATRSEEMLGRLIDAGMDVARLNMSHGDHEGHRQVAETIRRLASARGRTVAILLDLSGPKIRLGELEEPLDLEAEDTVTLTAEDVTGRDGLLPVTYPPLADEMKPGDRLSMSDGRILLQVTAVSPPTVACRVLSGGRVSSRKGVNLPGGGDALPSLTEKDKLDLAFGLELGVDWVALSFVRSPADAEGPRAIMRQHGLQVPILAKIEKQQALGRIDAILDAFDGLMVARGDLGVEIPLEEVPTIQKDLIRRANRKAKPVITATQMLLSMVENPRPTRAEVADVANAVLDGSDAVMLSEETAMGRHPELTVRTMDRIIAHAERQVGWNSAAVDRLELPGTAAAIAGATWHVARDVGARCIATPTQSGWTGRLVAATRPDVPILGLSSDPRTVHALALIRGVLPWLLPQVTTTDELFAVCRDAALESGLAEPGQKVAVTAGLPIHQAGTTNLLKVLDV